MKGRILKQRVLDLLGSEDLDFALEVLCSMPLLRVINSLFSFLYSTDEQIKWRAITAMGAAVARLADEDMEQARIIMRRLMWNLNDESGGIGWGSPEAMGEILACHELLANEYVSVLISYARKDGNYLELEMLQRGLLWGVARLSQVRPYLVQDAVSDFMQYLQSIDPAVRGLAAWLMGLLEAGDAREALEALTDDDARLSVYKDRKLINCNVKELAEEALKKVTKVTKV
ncbi:MAG: HEAT repeat domain-containing protein [Desulfobacteraceae bacterium]|uniref:HEAT repeat domain-containing protein n=1 Tax=Candidatus Desulfacyla euxinica TaxID=2841693 RepID=A0A8J6MXC3_9DELT|nr:HEAT repeat domain-containing protein [Candidatus Desulfacyla euxinica]MBL6977854.1 HEAT repeat domain-containing protein [Desulfobacteraceae bacterium]